jgi:hypothetical protein
MLRTVFDKPLARAFGVLWMVGFLVFETMAILVFHRIGSSSSIPFVAAAIVLFVLSLWTLWRNPWALGFGTLLSASQFAGVVGCIADLRSGTSAMRSSLIAAGVDPTTGLWLHLIFSSVGSVFFVWALVRFIRLRSHGPRPASGTK